MISTFPHGPVHAHVRTYQFNFVSHNEKGKENMYSYFAVKYYFHFSCFFFCFWYDYVLIIAFCLFVFFLFDAILNIHCMSLEIAKKPLQVCFIISFFVVSVKTDICYEMCKFTKIITVKALIFNFFVGEWFATSFI
jgi:hypothetical protein